MPVLYFDIGFCANGARGVCPIPVKPNIPLFVSHRPAGSVLFGLYIALPKDAGTVCGFVLTLFPLPFQIANLPARREKHNDQPQHRHD